MWAHLVGQRVRYCSPWVHSQDLVVGMEHSLELTICSLCLTITYTASLKDVEHQSSPDSGSYLP